MGVQSFEVHSEPCPRDAFEDPRLPLSARTSTPRGGRVCLVIAFVIVASFVLACVLASLGQAAPKPSPPEGCPSLTLQKTNITRADIATMGTLFGLHAVMVNSSSTFVIFAALAVMLSTLTSALVVTFHPENVPPDFEQKATLSNVSQDTSTPHGRMFTVALFTASLLMLLSQYTTWLYPPWLPWWRPHDIFMHTVYESPGEQFMRIAWVALPNVGLMFTAAIPSLSDISGYRFVLMLVHNIAAPLSLGFALVMETVQASYGERLFEYFFSNANRMYFSWPLDCIGADCTATLCPLWPDISWSDRLRAVVIVYAWTSIACFLPVQIYLGLGLVGYQIRTSYRLAEISFYGEVMAMIFTFSLPAIQGLHMLVIFSKSRSVFHSAHVALSLAAGSSNLDF